MFLPVLLLVYIPAQEEINSYISGSCTSTGVRYEICETKYECWSRVYCSVEVYPYSEDKTRVALTDVFVGYLYFRDHVPSALEKYANNTVNTCYFKPNDVYSVTFDKPELPDDYPVGLAFSCMLLAVGGPMFIIISCIYAFNITNRLIKGPAATAHTNKEKDLSPSCSVSIELSPSELTSTPSSDFTTIMGDAIAPTQPPIAANIESSSTSSLTFRTDSSMEPSSARCIICMERRLDSALIPCGHASFCETCTASLLSTSSSSSSTGVCPICRSPITSSMKIFL
eukprot:TRINITY_DN16367_c0_g1_i1.p1 TRINITY_DN16367_c0_g1~~TRINITY_DN16367_c0_g1_i1.p1  ORF type:complete len:321 (+),score=35.18 TRINITY_DN16367_c0_g1_i1:112-963(+)